MRASSICYFELESVEATGGEHSVIGFLKDIVRRRRLWPVIRNLPHVLKQRYGAAVFYTAEQVRTAAISSKLSAAAFPSAFAVACSAGEFIKADPLTTELDYVAIRAEITRLFAIDLSDLNCRSLRSVFREPAIDNSLDPYQVGND